MKNLHTLLTAAVMGWIGVSAGAAQAGNYRPVSPTNTAAPAVAQKMIGPPELKSANATGESKTACFYDSCYTVPVCSGSVCTPVVRCNSVCSPYIARPYFPATTNCGYGGCGYGYGGYPGYGYGGYVGYSNYGYGAGYGGYGVGGYGVGGYGVGGYGVGGYGGYAQPVYGAPVITQPVMPVPGYGTPYYP